MFKNLSPTILVCHSTEFWNEHIFCHCLHFHMFWQMLIIYSSCKQCTHIMPPAKYEGELKWKCEMKQGLTVVWDFVADYVFLPSAGVVDIQWICWHAKAGSRWWECSRWFMREFDRKLVSPHIDVAWSNYVRMRWELAGLDLLLYWGLPDNKGALAERD